MTIIRSYQNGFEVVDQTANLLVIPNKWGLVNQLGLFQEEGIAMNSIMIEQIDQSLALITDKVRGERASVGKDYTRKMHSFPVPHFPHDDAILPTDIQGKRAFGENKEESLAAVRARKLERIRQNHAATLEAARCQALTAGTVYAPSGTVSVDWYSSFSITKKTVDFVFSVGTTDIRAKIEEVIAHIQDNMLTGEIPSEVVFLCSPGWFASLIGHAKVEAAYTYYSSSQEPLRNRLVGSLGANVREFVWAGARFIEYRGSYNGSVLIPANEAYAFPMGSMDSFKTYFAPANKLDYVNTEGQAAYVFEFADPKGGKIELESESNFINVLRRPAIVVKATKS